MLNYCLDIWMRILTYSKHLLSGNQKSNEYRISDFQGIHLNTLKNEH